MADTKRSPGIRDRLRTLLREAPPFDQLPVQVREELLGRVAIKYFAKGEVILRQLDMADRGLYIVESGLVRLMDVEQQRLIDKCAEGDCFGSFSLIKGGTHIYEAKALEPTVCAVMRPETFMELYDAYEDVAAYFDRDIKRYVRRLGTTLDVTGAYILFDRPLHEFAHHQAVTCDGKATAREAARLMSREGEDAVLVTARDKLAGIITQGDLVRRLVARGRRDNTTVRRFMSSPVATISSEASLFDAMMIMLERRVRRLVIVDGAGCPLGVLTDRDLVHFRGLDPTATVQRIDGVTTTSALTNIRTEVGEQLLHLYQQGVSPELLSRIGAAINDRIVVRVLELVETELQAAAETPEQERVELPWSWLRLGSGGRQEMAFSSPQHNAILFADPASEAEAARAGRWFAQVAERANQALETCGFPAGILVARDDQQRGALQTWQQNIRSLLQQISTEAPDALLPEHDLLLFDLRGVYGDVSLVQALKQAILEALEEEPEQCKHLFQRMVTGVLQRRPPLSFFGRFVVERSEAQRRTFDIRERGITIVVNAARLLALEVGYLGSTNTYDRLRHAAERLPELSALLEETLDAYQYLVDFRLEHQLRMVDAGETPDNRIDPFFLTKMQQNLLRRAFTTVDKLQEALRRRYDRA